MIRRTGRNSDANRALGVTLYTATVSNSAQLIDNEEYVMETVVIPSGAGGYLFNATADAQTIGITLGARIPGNREFRIRGPASFQVASNNAMNFSIISYLSVLDAEATNTPADIEYLLTESGDDLLTEISEPIELEQQG